MLELTWGAPAFAAALPDAVAVPGSDELPLEAGAAGAVVLVSPPCGGGARRRVPRRRAGGRRGRPAGRLRLPRPPPSSRPPGWTGREAPGPGDVPLALAAAGHADAALRERLGVRTIDDRERWLSLFAAGAFGPGEQRLWIFERDEPLPVPDAVRYDPSTLRRIELQAVAPSPATPHPRRAGARRRARRELRVARELARIRVARARGCALGRGDGRAVAPPGHAPGHPQPLAHGA